MHDGYKNNNHTSFCVLSCIIASSGEKVLARDVGVVKFVTLLGIDAKVARTQNDRDVEIEMPLFRQGAVPCDHALVFKITLD
jgi:hypothetical protein